MLRTSRLASSGTTPVVVGAGAILAIAVGAGAAVFGYWALLVAVLVLVCLFGLLEWKRSQLVVAASSGLEVPRNWALIAMPTLLASGAVSLSVGIAVMGCVVLASFSGKISNRGALLLRWPTLLLPVAGALIVTRLNYPSTALNAIFFIVSCVALIRVVALSESRISASVSLIDGVGMYVIVSVFLWVIGIRGSSERTSGLENALTGGERVEFPLANSLAATPNMAAIYCVAIVPVLVLTRQHLLFRLSVLAACIVVFALSDARVSLLGATLLAAFVFLFPRLFRLFAPALVAFSLAVPFIYASVQSIVGRVVSTASTQVPWLIRQGEEASTLNQRDYIWTQSIGFYRSDIDWIRQAIGFGAYGHAESGVSGVYASRFGGLARDDRLMTPHNSTLQLLFDGGWFVALVVAVMVLIMAVRFSKSARRSPHLLVALSALVMVAVVSATEVAMSPSHAQPAWWVLVALSVICFSGDRDLNVQRVDGLQRLPANVPVGGHRQG